MIDFDMIIQGGKNNSKRPENNSEAVTEWYLQFASSSVACFSPGWGVPAALLLLVVCLAPCCHEEGGSPAEAGVEIGWRSVALPGSYLARWTPGSSYGGTEALVLQPTRTSLPEPCAALSTSKEHQAPGRHGSMDTAEPETKILKKYLKKYIIY